MGSCDWTSSNVDVWGVLKNSVCMCLLKFVGFLHSLLLKSCVFAILDWLCAKSLNYVRLVSWEREGEYLWGGKQLQDLFTFKLHHQWHIGNADSTIETLAGLVLDVPQGFCGFCSLEDGWAYVSTRRLDVPCYIDRCANFSHWDRVIRLHFWRVYNIQIRNYPISDTPLPYAPTYGRSILPPCHLGWGRPLGFPFSAGRVSRKPCRDWSLKSKSLPLYGVDKDGKW